MKKILLLFAALISLNILMPQKASAQQFIKSVTIEGINYNLMYADFADSYYAVVRGFPPETEGFAIIPESFEAYVGGDGKTTFTVTDVNLASHVVNEAINGIDIPATVNYVIDNSFKNYTCLDHLIVRAEVPPIILDGTYKEVSESDLFTKLPNMYVPSESVQTYKDNPHWGKTSSIYPISRFVAINNISAEDKAVKHIENGQLLIERNGKMFNAIGTQVR